MKIFSAYLATETNTFASIPTGMGSFEEFGIYRGDGSAKAPNGVGSFLSHIKAKAAADDNEIVESISAFAQPGGRTVRSAYETLRGMILEDLHAASPVDGVLLFLHGAMAADGYDDCEGDLLSRIREIVGPNVPIGVELDLHCHFTELMATSADAIICLKEYPHTDGYDRADELYRILVDAMQRRIRPVTAVFDCKMVGQWHTTREPMATFVRRMKSFEGSEGILSVSLGHGFPWGDVSEAGAKLWVIANADGDKARILANQLGHEFWALRHDTKTKIVNADSAITEALCEKRGPVILADMADNPGGGAPSDSTFILRQLLDRGVENFAIGAFWDLGAVHICREAGVGASLNLRLGGKVGLASGEPLDIKVTVRAIHNDHSQHSDIYLPTSFGPSVWVEVPGQIDILITSIRNQIMGTSAFTGIGIELCKKRLIVVKSMQHFYASFAPVAANILYVSTPGAVRPVFEDIPYKNRTLLYWPRVDDPYAE